MMMLEYILTHLWCLLLEFILFENSNAVTSNNKWRRVRHFSYWRWRVCFWFWLCFLCFWHVIILRLFCVIGKKGVVIVIVSTCIFLRDVGYAIILIYNWTGIYYIDCLRVRVRDACILSHIGVKWGIIQSWYWDRLFGQNGVPWVAKHTDTYKFPDSNLDLYRLKKIYIHWKSSKINICNNKGF